MDLDTVRIAERDVRRFASVAGGRVVDGGLGLEFAEIGREDRAAEMVRTPVGEAAAGVVDVAPPAVAAGPEIAVAAAGVVLAIPSSPTPKTFTPSAASWRVKRMLASSTVSAC